MNRAPRVVRRYLRAIEFIARREIDRGEELTINYNWDPEDKTPVGFEVR